MPANFYLSVLSGNKKDRVYPIEKLPIKIGRMSDNDIVLKDTMVSRHHASIFMKDRTFFVEDLKSKNGTFVNNVRVGSRKLNVGDRITIGKNIILFEAGEKDIFSREEDVEFTTVKPAKTILKDITDRALDYSSSEIDSL